jgi:hypothetical protein
MTHTHIHSVLNTHHINLILIIVVSPTLSHRYTEIRTYIHTYIHTYIFIQLHTFILSHTYILSYLHRHRRDPHDPTATGFSATTPQHAFASSIQMHDDLDLIRMYVYTYRHTSRQIFIVIVATHVIQQPLASLQQLRNTPSVQ